MLNPIKKTILYDQNALYYGYPIEKLMEKAGEGIARELVKKYGKGKKIGFFCGPGNNGGDGFAAARYLLKNSYPEVYLITSEEKINTSESRKNWKKLKGPKKDNLRAKDIPNHFDVVADCLFGTGIKGKLRKPYPEIIEKLNKLKGKKVAIDLPAPGFIPQFNISMMFPKTKGAVVVDIGFPKSIEEKIGVGEVKVLNKPKDNSRKGDNGKLLIIGGSERYHGAPLIAANIASRLVDLVYFSSVPENNKLLAKMKSRLAEFIAVPREEIEQFIKKTDAILIGPGLGMGEAEKKLVNNLVKKFKNKQFILDADALNLIEKKNIPAKAILTPHKGEFKKLFGINPTRENALKMAQKYNCVIALKGKIDYVAGSGAGENKINITGNAGMTKGGTGDCLAGLISGLATRNEPFLAASAGVFLNGLAGDRLAKRVGSYYNATDLAREIPKTLKWCEDY